MSTLRRRSIVKGLLSMIAAQWSGPSPKWRREKPHEEIIEESLRVIVRSVCTGKDLDAMHNIYFSHLLPLVCSSNSESLVVRLGNVLDQEMAYIAGADDWMDFATDWIGLASDNAESSCPIC